MEKSCKNCNKKFNKPVNESIKNWKIRHFYCSDKCKYNSRKGNKLTEEHKRKIGEKSKGHKLSPESRKKIADSKRGNKSHFWKGGLTEINKTIRHSLEYRLWRETIYERDNWTCVWCKVRGGKLAPDHIKPFAMFPELRFAIDNGRTLCHDCHKKTDTYGKNYTDYSKKVRDKFGRFTGK